MASLIQVSSVSKSFFTRLGETKVFDDISFEVKDNEILAIVGPSGCGKSTILNLISGLIPPTSGTVVSNSRIGYMFQKDNLFEWRNVIDNITLGLEITHQLKKESYDDIDKLLVKYHLDDFKEFYPSNLSGGMRQRVALIRTLALKPNLLLLDEPFSAIDYQSRLLLQEDVFRIIKEEQISAIIVTHDISEAIAFSDRVLVLGTRPCQIKNIHTLSFTLPDGEINSPLSRRKSPEFKNYFNLLFKELTIDEKDHRDIL